MYQIKFQNGYEIQVMGSGDNAPCRVTDRENVVRFEGPYAACEKWLASRAVHPLEPRPESPIPNAVFFLHPEGSAWIAAKFHGGQLVARAEESNAATHAAANDTWAGVVPSEDDEQVSGLLAEAIIREVMGEGVNVKMVAVTRAGE